MGSCGHDQGLGIVRGLASDIGEFVNSQIGQIVACVNTRFAQFGNQLKGQALDVTQVLGRLQRRLLL